LAGPTPQWHLSADPEKTFKRLEKTRFAATFGDLFPRARRALVSKLWMTCVYSVGRGWTQNLVLRSIPATVKSKPVDSLFLRHKML
jgi:hypothetical protein